MKTSILFLILSISIFLFNCSQRKSENANMEMAPMEEASSANSPVSSSAAVENGKDTTRKFIRTADLKFKVKSVIHSTYKIEDITTRNGGFVTFTNLASNVDYVTQTAVSADSSLETTYFTVSNSMTIRVPNTKLDTTLKEIAKYIEFLDYRIIKADNVALQILSNNLTQKRSAKNEARLTDAIDKRGKKLDETTWAEEALLNKQEQSDNAKISNLSLIDQIQFSTITLSLYQRQTIQRELISNDKNIDAYEPSFGSKILDSLNYGWEILEAIFITIAKCWGLILFGVLAFILYKKYRQKLKVK